MKKLRDAIVRESFVENRIVYLCISGSKIELFYIREKAMERARQLTVVFA